MNSIFLAIIAFIIFLSGYHIYGRLIAKLFKIDPEHKTPAHTNYDGRDYIPARHWMVLFGHHFASIAGAGPILGPVIAVIIWGWGPAILWIFLGSIFIGGVHDFSSLLVSVREQGRSIAHVAETALSHKARIFFSIFLWFTLVLVIAVFAASAAKTLSTTPQVVIPTFGLLVVAYLVGIFTYRLNLNLFFATVIGIVLLFALILLGYYIPIYGSFRLWFFVLLGYAYLASVIPVNVLLQPRDYIASFVLFFGLVFGYIGLFITHPVIHTPVFIKWEAPQGGLWPMMFVIIACGAISGFHSLVASGTSSKQLANESDAQKIGYGSMLTEGLLATLAILAVTAGLYWKSGPSGLMYPALMKGGNWIKTFGTGYGQLIKPLFGALGMLIGITMLKTFIMTTLDSATRIARYIGDELFGEVFRLKPFRNIYFNTGVIIAFAMWLGLGSWQAIWPVFGAANQLVAALTLFVVTAWLLGRGWNIRYTIYPGIFMLITTGVALGYELVKFSIQGKFLLAGIALILLVFAVFMVLEVFRVMTKSRS
ncbi:carbon starvation protein A [candidate division WOR-3 bacterium 4484_100]|uniref:Carbon starvation protein A n=1 Tax=candidate division WOR-3 bacterium 4484_100 TaxID=1936077 RepID=A0A1V4QGM9_UNCW3|nr:MAG: carbon starvation protein A [candidate division WOR-3 bacterium 4484_100]